MIAFHKLLPEDSGDHNEIILKYRYNLPDGSVVWVGLITMVESNTLWKEMLCSFGSEYPILGVFFEGKTSVGTLEGMPDAIYLHKATENFIWTTENRHPDPRTYQVCFEGKINFVFAQTCIQDLRRLVYTLEKRKFANVPSHLPTLEIYTKAEVKFLQLEPGDYLNALRRYRADIYFESIGIQRNVVAIRFKS